MKKIKMIIAAVAIAAFGTSASAQYWGESEVTNYIYAGYSSFKMGETMPGVHLGLGDINQINMGNWFWDYNVDFAYNWKSNDFVKMKAWSGRIGMDLLYKIDASENVFVFPFVGIASRNYLYGKSTVMGEDFNWFSNNGYDGSRYQVCAQAGVHTFIGSIMLRAEYQYYFTKVFSGGDKASCIMLSVGYRF